MRFGIVGILCAAISIVTPALGDEQQGDRLDTGDEISGQVFLRGCDASDVTIMMRATPIERGQYTINPGLFDDNREDASAVHDLYRTRVIRAERVAGGIFSFRFEELDRNHLYRIGIRAIPPAGGRFAPPNPCARLLWEGLPSSMAIAGGPPVQITGTATPGTLKVFNAPPDSASRQWPARWQRNWAGAGSFDFTEPGRAMTRLAWTPPRGVTQGIVQVSLERFERDLDGDRCEIPDGLLFHQDVDVSDLEWQPGGGYRLPPLDLSTIIVPPPSPDDGISDAADLPFDGPPDLVTATVSEGEYQKILLGKPLYARILPVTADGPACDTDATGIPPWIVLVVFDALGVIDPPAMPDEVSVGPLAIYQGPVVYNLPNHDHLCMRSVRPHDINFFGVDLLLINSTNYGIGDTFPANKRFCWKTGGGGGGFDPIGAITEVIGGVISPFEWFVNGISDIWASVKAFATDAVADGMAALGIPCNADCRSVLTTGLEIGLVAAGLPPTLPNFDQLKQEGLDYVAAQIASQTGLPNEVTSYAVNHGYKALASEFTDQVSAARGSGIPFADWAVWDSGIEPATLTIGVQRAAVGALPTALYLPANAVYDSVRVPLPKVFVDQNGQPGANSMAFNIVLPPNMDGWKQPDPTTYQWLGTQLQLDPTQQQIASSQKNFWKSRILQNGCVPMQVRRTFQVYGFNAWLGDDVLANFPGVPVSMNTSQPHLTSFQTAGIPGCYP